MTTISLNFSLFFPMPIRNFNALFRNNYDFFRTKIGCVLCIRTSNMILDAIFNFTALSTDSEHFKATQITHYVKLQLERHILLQFLLLMPAWLPTS